MLPEWTVPNNYKLAELEENVTVAIDLPLASLNNVTVSIISGSLPLGLRLENNRIVGTPFEVDRPTTSTFVIRAKTTQGISDRTFFILVSGADSPQWITSSGRLPVGNNSTLFVLDNSLIDFQLLADDKDLPVGQRLDFRLTSGQLPPGINLTSDGRLVGVIDPLLALEINVVSANYDQNPLDSVPYDFGFGSLPDQKIPRKLNREYFFTVSVSDNVSSVSRQFQIFVVSDDFVRADNAIMKAADGVFTADITFLRVPIWLTAADLGKRRANNYLTVFLDAFDATTLPGKLQYFLEPFNDDGSPSVVPPGLLLDSNTGELAGRVPYQPATTVDYKFTVNAVRFNTEVGLFTVFGTATEDTLANKTNTFRIAKVSRATLGQLNELQRLVGEKIVIENREYTVISVDQSNANYDTITFGQVIEPLNGISLLQRNRAINSNQDWFFANSLTESDRNFYLRKKLKYSDTEIYEITDVYPYIEWEISTESNEPLSAVNGDDSSLLEDYLTNLFSINLRPAVVQVTRNSFDQAVNIKLLIPATAQNRNSSYISSLFVADDNAAITVSKLDENDRIKLDQNIFGGLVNDLNMGIPIGLSLTRGSSFNKTFAEIEKEVASKKKTFNIKILGEVDSVITWITPTNLGTLAANRISTLFVEAITTVQDANVKYSITNGVLPFGLTLSQDGEIIGKVPVTGTVDQPGLVRFVDNGSITTFDFGTTTFDREYTFTVLAQDRFKYSATERQFVIRISDEDNLNYSNIFIKPLLKQNQRQLFTDLVDNSRIFPPDLIYRPGDPNFGIQKSLKCLFYAGIENLDLEKYVAAVEQNHKRMRFYLGDLKTAVARIPGTDRVIYEIVYVEIFDQTRGAKVSVLTDTSSTDIATIETMQLRIKNITVDNRTAITSKDFLPLWMRSAQDDSLNELGFVLALPVAYTKPGQSQTIKENIINAGFDFKQLEFDIDRYIIDSTRNVNREQYILFESD
jgi:hypothetical protein